MERSQNFAGYTAVVTGAARGIGKAIAENLQARGASLILVDRNAEGLSGLAEKMGGKAVAADLSSPAEIETLIQAIASLSFRIDVLVNNAGIERDIPLEGLTAQVFDEIIATNLRAPLLLAQGLIPLFPQEGGAIVNISSIHASHAFPNAIPYACSKAGMIALTRNLALELAGRRIRVNAVCPGYIDTAMWDEWLRTQSAPEKISLETARLHPLGRRGLPNDVAEAVAWLASPQAEWVTGTHLIVDGGLTIRAHT